MSLIRRSSNRGCSFLRLDDYQFYLDQLGEARKKYKVEHHAYVLMTNHLHLLMTPKTGEGPTQVMKHLGQRCVQYVTRTHRRSATLWEGKLRSRLIREEDYFLVCQRYIKLNPVRAGMVKRLGEYPWYS